MPTRMFVYLVLFLVFAVSGAAHQFTGNETLISTGASTGQGKKEIVTVDEPPTSYRKLGQAEISYFSGSDITEVRTQWPTYKGDRLSASMWFEFRTKGRSLLRPKIVAVNIGFFGEKTRLESLATFALEVDDKSVALDGPSLGDVGYDLNAKRFFKTMHGSISFETFEKLVNSKSVKVHSGEIVFELSKSNRNALRDMLNAVQERSNHPW